MEAVSDENRRVHDRTNLEDQRAGSIIHGGRVDEIVDISFSGFAVKGKVLLTGPFTLKIFDKKITCEARCAYANDIRSGYAFVHEGASLLVFLQPFLESMRWGSTLQPVPAEMLKDKYKEGDWLLFRGDGPTDLTLKRVDGDLESGLLVFRNGQVYEEIRYRNEIIATGRTIDQEGVASRVADTRLPEPSIARLGLSILLGIRDNEVRKLVAPLFSLGYQALKL